MELLSFYSYALASTLTILIGLIYATRKTIMPYHLKALEKTWEEIDVNYQLMLNRLLNGGGFYGVSCGVFMLVLLLIPFNDGQLWAGYTIGLAGLVGTLPLTYIVYKVKTTTKGDPPLWVMIIVDVLLVIGLLGVVLS